MRLTQVLLSSCISADPTHQLEGRSRKKLSDKKLKQCLASQDALEVMRVTEWLSYLLIVSIDFTDVTLVSDDTYRRLYWCDPDYSDDPDESYLVMKVI